MALRSHCCSLQSLHKQIWKHSALSMKNGESQDGREGKRDLSFLLSPSSIFSVFIFIASAFPIKSHDGDRSFYRRKGRGRPVARQTKTQGKDKEDGIRKVRLSSFYLGEATGTRVLKNLLSHPLPSLMNSTIVVFPYW